MKESTDAGSHLGAASGNRNTTIDLGGRTKESQTHWDLLHRFYRAQVRELWLDLKRFAEIHAAAPSQPRGLSRLTLLSHLRDSLRNRNPSGYHGL